MAQRREGARIRRWEQWRPVSTLTLRRPCTLAARGKRRSPAVAAFLLDRAQQLAELERQLDDGSYRPGVGRAFWIHEPKPRRIYALPFRDRVVQHLLIGATLPAFERWFAPQSYACRVGKGTHRCLERAAELTRTKRYVLHLDFQKFFHSIDHALLRELLLPHTPRQWRWLTELFLDAPSGVEPATWYFPGDDLFTPLERRRGLPIGSLTSQIWANAYLTPIDHLLGSHLGLGSFVRYCDDLLIFDNDPARLREALAALEERATALRLRLHPRKTRLYRTTDALRFLGFVLQRRGDAVAVRLLNENVRRFRRRMASTLTLWRAGAIEYEDVAARLRAWLAHAAHGHTRTLCRRELARLELLHE